jgi:hypothetical protein
MMENGEAKVHHSQDRYAHNYSNVETAIEMIPERLTGARRNSGYVDNTNQCVFNRHGPSISLQ